MELNGIARKSTSDSNILRAECSEEKINAMIEAIKAAHFNQAKYQTTTIINADDAVVGTGMFVKSSAEKGKKEKCPIAKLF